MSERQAGANRAFVLGLDGVPWDILGNWIDDGHLPNFERLRDGGASGPLESTMPPTTALAWPSIATGVWPDKHGVYGFQRLEGNYTHRMSTSRDVDQPALWNQLSPSVVANVPMTYPASPIDGDLVTGMMSPAQNEGFTHPPELRNEIRNRIPDYEIGLTWSEYGGRQEEFLDDLDSLLENRRELLRLLMEREDWRLFFFVFTAPDRLQHLCWDEQVMIDHYRKLDDVLGEVMAYVEEHEANLFVVSDHGFGPIEKHVAVNRVLEQGGFLTRRDENGVRSLLADLGVSKQGVRSALGTIGIDEGTIVNALPRRFVDTVASQVPGSHALYDVDFTQTVAFVHGRGCVYVNDTERFDDGIVDPENRDEVKEDVADLFAMVTDPETDQQVLEVADGDDLFPTDEHSPDLIVCAIDGYNKVASLKDDVFTPATTTQASHRSEGVLFAWGPDVETGVTIESADVVDLAPTVLHSLGESVPTGADGDVRDEILTETATVTEADLEPESPETVAAGGVDDDDFEEVEERLRGLGYMD